MPTATGLPRPNEIWQRTWKLPPDWKEHSIVFRVVERSRGDYWALRVNMLTQDGKPLPTRSSQEAVLMVDAAYWFGRGELTYLPNGLMNTNYDTVVKDIAKQVNELAERETASPYDVLDDVRARLKE